MSHTRVLLFSACLAIVLVLPGLVSAADTVKIGTISLEWIVQNSKKGQEAKKQLEAKAAELKEKLQADQKELDRLRTEIETKSSVWSVDVRAEKEREYQKKMRSFQIKSEDAQYELKQLEAKVMGPILKDLHAAIAKVGKENGFTIILENSRKGLKSQIGLMYADESLDISDLVLKALDKE